MDKVIRFGLIGCGRMGRRRAALVAKHPKAELVYVCDVNQEAAQALAMQHGCLYLPDVEEAIARADVDCLIISVPNKWHAELVDAALRAGKHVFCEKPLARTPSEAARLVATSEKSGVTLKVGSNLRYFPNVLKAKSLLDARAIGEVVFLRAWIGHDGWNLREQWYSDPEIIGGGPFLDNGSHVLDLTRWFLGEPLSCVGTVQTALWPIAPLEDNGYGIFQMQGGAVATIHASWTEWKGYLYMEIYGSRGYLRIDNRGNTCTTVAGNRGGQEEVFDFSGLPPTSYDAEFEDYVKAITESRQPVPSGYDGLRAVEMAWAVYESSRTGRRVNLYPTGMSSLNTQGEGAGPE